VTGRCALTFKTVSGTFFYEMEQDVRRFLDSLRPEFDLRYRAVTDSYGYMWVIFEGQRIEDLLAGLTAAGDIVEEKGFSDQLLAAVFEFYSERQGGSGGGCGGGGGDDHQYIIYNYKRNNFYPFVPVGRNNNNNNKSRDTEKEMKIMAAVAEEMPFEKDMGLWYPLWDLPLRAPG
jgi:PspAB-like protein